VNCSTVTTAGSAGDAAALCEIQHAVGEVIRRVRGMDASAWSEAKPHVYLRYRQPAPAGAHMAAVHAQPPRSGATTACRCGADRARNQDRSRSRVSLSSGSWLDGDNAVFAVVASGQQVEADPVGFDELQYCGGPPLPGPEGPKMPSSLVGW
jgi:hypothetical protein